MLTIVSAIKKCSYFDVRTFWSTCDGLL